MLWKSKRGAKKNKYGNYARTLIRCTMLAHIAANENCKGSTAITHECRNEKQMLNNLNSERIMKLNDEDIAVVEFMHDRLLDVYNEKQNVDYLVKARKTTNKMYSIVNGAKTRTEPVLPLQSVSDSALNDTFKKGYKAAIDNLNACYKDIFD